MKLEGVHFNNPISSGKNKMKLALHQVQRIFAMLCCSTGQLLYCSSIPFIFNPTVLSVSVRMYSTIMMLIDVKG